MTPTRFSSWARRAALVAAAALPFLLSPARASADDTSPFNDWKDVKKRGAAHAKERAQFWTDKGSAVGKDLLWVGLMWHRADELDKAIAVFQDYLKVPEMKEQNRENAYDKLMDAYYKAGKWDDVAATAEKYRSEFASTSGSIVAESWDTQGRAARMAGAEDKALAAFTAAAEMKLNNGVVDLLDVHVAAGRIDEAKKIGAKYMESDIKGKDLLLQPYLAFVDLIGSPAPSLEKAASVGKLEAPTDWKGKPAVFLHWTMQTPNGDRRLQRLEGLRRQWGEKVNVVGLSTYKHYNPEAQKIEAGMSEELERDWFKKFIETSTFKFPPCIVVPGDVMEGLKQKYEGQLTVLDGEGWFRYLRINDMTSYDLDCVSFALKAVTGSAPEK